MQLAIWTRRVATQLLLSALLIVAWPHAAYSALPSAREIESQLEKAKQAEQTDDTAKDLVKDLEETQRFIADIAKQKEQNAKLVKNIENADKGISASQSNINKLKADKLPTAADLSKYSLAELQQQLEQKQITLQNVQDELAQVNADLVSQRSAPERAQQALAENAKRAQAINQVFINDNLSKSRKTRLEAEQTLLDLQNTYNQTLLQGTARLMSLYSLIVEERTLQQQQLQNELNTLQSAINEKNLQLSKEQVEQATQNQEKNAEANTNPVVAGQLNFNTQISKDILEETTRMNSLSQDNLRIKNVLGNLQQTQRNIEEQISSLQGTLVLSRIINKQRQSLPQDEMISGLGKRIADLRVKIFDITEFRDKLYDTDGYIKDLEQTEKVTLSAKDRAQVADLVEERRKLLSDYLSLLNNQLNLSINIELNQQQVQSISDSLQNKLQQQSFWVKSNSVMDWDWFKSFPESMNFQRRALKRNFDFSNWREHLLPGLGAIGLLLILTALIRRKKENIKKRLNKLNQQINVYATDTQWHTPKAIFWVAVLSLPSTFLFLAGFILVTGICFKDPATVWPWGLKMAAYWWSFAFMLGMLRPNGIGHHHFNMPKESNEAFRNMLKRSAWIIALLLNVSIFSHIDLGLSYDVIGQASMIIVLVTVLLIMVPRFRQAVSSYQKSAKEQTVMSQYFLPILRVVLLLVPVVLIVLTAMGYYYTAIVLIEHAISSYFVVMTWWLICNVVYRGFAVAARRMAYRRAKEKREQLQTKVIAEANSSLNPDMQEIQYDDSIAISEIKTQMLRVADFLLWIALFGMLYWVWSDLVTAAYYLDSISLWRQTTSGENGTTVTESITLLNLFVAIAIMVVTYVLVRNISGLLETLVFSHARLSQGTPYTITTLLTYAIIALGATFAFGALGVSWSKLQWLFAALSVGLGFGMQEIFANFVSGIIILFERPVRIGDIITLGEFSGTVSKIRIRATTLVDFDGKEVIVPNKSFVTERLVNWALSDTVTRVIARVGVGYGADLELTKKLLLQAATDCELVLKDPAPVVYFLNFGASTLDHELRVYVGHVENRNPTLDYLNRRINQLLTENNIDIAFNQLDIFIKNLTTNEELKVGETVEFKK